MKNRTLIVLAGLTVAGFANASLVGNLYLAQGGGANATGYVNQIFPDFPTFSTVGGNVVTVGGSGWNVANVQGEYTGPATFSAGVNSGVLTVSTFGATPTVNHISGVSAGAGIVYSGNVTATVTNLVGTLFNFEANTTGISQLQGLAAGTYLFTFTPVASFGTLGQAFNTLSTDTSNDSWARNDGGGFGLPGGTGWATMSSQFTIASHSQYSLGVNGSTVVPEPATIAVLGLGALGLLRRKRKNS